VHGAGLADRAEIGRELRAQQVSQRLDDLRKGGANREGVGGESGTRIGDRVKSRDVV
jgi:hypothetical protein